MEIREEYRNNANNSSTHYSKQSISKDFKHRFQTHHRNQELD